MLNSPGRPAGADHRGDVPEGVRGDHAVGPSRHCGHGLGRRCAAVDREGRDRCHGSDAGRSGAYRRQELAVIQNVPPSAPITPSDHRGRQGADRQHRHDSGRRGGVRPDRGDHGAAVVAGLAGRRALHLVSPPAASVDHRGARPRAQPLPRSLTRRGQLPQRGIRPLPCGAHVKQTDLNSAIAGAFAPASDFDRALQVGIDRQQILMHPLEWGCGANPFARQKCHVIAHPIVGHDIVDTVLFQIGSKL